MINYHYIEFPLTGGKNGILTMIQSNAIDPAKSLPFKIKRVLIMKDMKPSDSRGGHTHHKTQQILFAVSGGCTVELDNGKEKENVRLNTFNKGLILYPYIWHVMKDFEPNTILLVLADNEYDERDYIRDYNEFLELVHKA